MAKRSSTTARRRHAAPASHEEGGVSARDIAIGMAGLAAALAVVYVVTSNRHKKEARRHKHASALGNIADQFGVTEHTGVDIGRYIGEVFLGPLIGTLIGALIGGWDKGRGKDEDEEEA